MINYRKLALTLFKILLKQVLLCLGILAFFTFYFGITLSNLAPSFTFGLFLLPVTLATANVFAFYLIPNYLIKERYGWFALYTVYAIVISVFFIVLSSFYGLLFSTSISGLDPDVLLTKNLYLVIIGVYMVVLLVSLFSVFRESYRINLSNRELQYALVNGQLQLKQEELSYLKMQIHPHFLFNTLNTIYGSAIAKKEQTPDLILKLSNLLDYILYQTKKTVVPLQDEIDHLKDYIELEKLRHGEKLKISATFPESSAHIFIPPMLLLPFLENSFKHGKGNEKQAFIELRIELIDSKIQLSLKNSREKALQQTKNESSGIGLANIKKRLELLFPEGHTLEIRSEEDSFDVWLELDTTKIKTHELLDRR
ncbi:sensor histidine kinase [Algoriphagus namhaensis]